VTTLQPEVLELERIHALEPPETSTETLLRWSQDDVFRLQMENLYLRQMAKEDGKDRTALRFSRNHWRLAAAIGFGFSIMTMVLR